MTRSPRWILVAALVASAAAAAGVAIANDSVAESAAGGLVLTRTDDIDMVSEDLYVSADEIRVRYVFRNRAPRDVTVTVAFPMPDRDFGELLDSDAAFPADFATRVDGRAVAMQVERRALLAGADHSALLRELGVPLGEDGVIAVGEAIDRLAPARQRQLVGLGLVETVEYDVGDGMRRYFEPRWTLTETWHWRQTFPAGRDLVVEHRYAPGVGGSVGTLLAFPELRNEPDARAAYADFCVDDAFIRAVDRMSARSTPDEPALLGEQRIRYILTTGANWRSPIADFRLVVDKGRADNIVSFCGENLRRISPTQFEMRRTNWRPDRDLAVLIVQPNREAE